MIEHLSSLNVNLMKAVVYFLQTHRRKSNAFELTIQF